MQPSRSLYQLPTPGSIREILETYLSADPTRGHRRTVEACDSHAGKWDELSADAVRTTVRPLLNSRITHEETAWFVEAGADAPFHLVKPEDSLVRADPALDGGLYDNLDNLYAHFWSRRPRGVSTAKIHKVLYVMRPNAYPILDSRLLKMLKPNAVASAAQLREVRGGEDRGRLNYWAAVRQLLIDNEATLGDVRQKLASNEDPFIRQAERFLSDVRLLDMVLWKAG